MAGCRSTLELLLAQHARAAALLEVRAEANAVAELDGVGLAASGTPSRWTKPFDAAAPTRAQIEALHRHEAEWTRTLESAATTAGMSHADRQLIADTLLPMQRSHEALLSELMSGL